jgi:hypothetical protein
LQPAEVNYSTFDRELLAADQAIKGIVSRDLNVVFTTNFLKMAPIRVRFTQGFLPGAGFHGKEFAPVWFETIT